jgi:AraC family transcriptional regulator
VGKVDYGVVFNMSEPAKGFDYLSGFEVSSISGLPGEFSHVKIPAERYVVFSHYGHVSKLKDTVTAIWRPWLPASGYAVSRPTPNAPDIIECYGEGFDPQTGIGDIEVWIPLKG